MLKANKSRLFEKIFAIYNRNLFRRRFHSCKISGLDFLRAKNPAKPLIVYVNHSSWWDGLTAFEISRAANLDSFVMMEEKQLKNLRLFQRLGAFSVVRENPREAVQSIRYAVNLLKQNSHRTLWIFPQGEILPNDLRPLKFYKGLAHMVEDTDDCAAVSVAMRYEFFGNYKPEVLVKIDAPEEFSDKNIFDVKKQTEYFEERLAKTLNDLKTDILTGRLQNYENII